MKQVRSRILSILMACAVASPVCAQLAVIDPANLTQNTLTALRELQQINNEIQQLANEAVMLTNEAKNLLRSATTSCLDYSRFCRPPINC